MCTPSFGDLEDETVADHAAEYLQIKSVKAYLRI